MKKILDLMSLTGRRALITGATGNLGQEIALTIAELGGDLILVDRPGSDYESLNLKILSNYDIKVEYFDCDLEYEQERIELIDMIKEDKKGLEILINNAAFVGSSSLNGWSCDFSHQTIETWRRAMEVNLTAAFHLCQGFSSILNESARSSIINIASIYATNGPDYSLYDGTAMANPAAYGVSKAGLLQLTRWLATTLAPQVRVNAISPGGIYRNQPEEFVERYIARTPLGRMANNNDLKGTIAYLASDLSEYVTGQNLLVDGGWTSW
jgi:NAD(P)-dependent dehydrogenase (short-subunit alcohol dehydrogenase family)